MDTQTNAGYAADGIQYASNEAYYLRAPENGVFPGNLTVRGNLTVTDGQIALGAGAFITNDETPNVITSVSGINALTVTATEVAAAVPLSAPSISSSGDLNVRGGAITGNGSASFWDGGSGRVTLSGGGNGPTGFGAIQSFATDGTTIAPLQLQPSGGAVSLPIMALGSCESVPVEPVAVTLPELGGPSGTFVIAGVRVMWGGVNGGSSASVNFIPDFGAVPCIFVQAQSTGIANGYATVGSPTVNSCTIALTATDGSGLPAPAYWLAIGAA